MSGALIETTRGRCEPQLDRQRAASQAVDGFCQQTLLRELDASSAALLDSQTGPYDLNVVPVRQDERRIEVIANGLPLWGGVQLAVDTTLVSPLTAAGMPRRDSGHTAGAALCVAERAKARTYPKPASGRRCRLVVLGPARH